MLRNKIQPHIVFYNIVYHQMEHCKQLLSMNNRSLDTNIFKYNIQSRRNYINKPNDTIQFLLDRPSDIYHSYDGFELLVTTIALYVSISGVYCLLRDYVLYSAPSPVFFIRNINNNAAPDEDQIHPLVVNLSNHVLTPAQYKLLCRGLKFCPSPGEPDLSSSEADLTSFHVRLKRYLHFLKPKRNLPSDQNNTSDILASQVNTSVDANEPFQHQKFKNPSAWVPPPVAPLEFFISKNCLDLANCNLPRPGRKNITPEESRALKELTRNRHIIIKPADKGGAVVIQNRDDYITEGLRQLQDPTFYSEQAIDLTQKHQKEIADILDDMIMYQQIHISCHNYLTGGKVRTAQFYMLPKIHKTTTNPPGRPIVSGNGCPTEKISQFIDFFLQPCVRNIRSYIKDTSDFLKMLESVGKLPKECILVTLDVASLYTNIPNQEGREAVLQTLDIYRGNVQNPSNTYLVTLLDKVLKCNNFEFNGRHFLQVGGTAMGTKVAPSYANTFMGWYEEKFVYTYQKQPLLWKRFIDDIFVIWQHTQKELDEFITFLNNRMPSIKFEADISVNSVHFLDVTVSIDHTTGSINTTLYTKPTDAHNYINYASCHQKSCRDGIPYGQFLRLRRICNKDDDFVSESKIMAYHFYQASYPPKLIQESFERAYLQNRDQLLQTKTETEDSVIDKLFLITTFHPTFNEVNRIVSKNMDLLDKSSSTRPALQARLVRGFRRCRNLRDHLVRARLPPAPIKGDDPDPDPEPHNNICGRVRCIYCDKLDRTGRITTPVTNRSYVTRTNVTCRCSNLIYALVCQTCGKIYVGQTKRRIMDRLMEHFRSIRQNNNTLMVSRHYNSTGHNGIEDMRVYILEFINAHPDSAIAARTRDTTEKRWIYRLRSLTPMGLNLFDINL